MVRATKKTRAMKAAKQAKAALRVIRRIATRIGTTQQHTPNQHAERLNEVETEQMNARLTRHEETKRRNLDSQSLPQSKRRKRKDRLLDANEAANHVNDNKGMQQDWYKLLRTVTNSCHFTIADFFDAIDAPLTRVCGSCGEVANAYNSKLKLFDPKSIFFSPLCNAEGECEIVPEGLVGDASNECVRDRLLAGGCSNNKTMIWLCDRCNRSLTTRKTPKFCRSSGFRIGTVPTELAELNRIESRLVGLGISFTTCVNQYRDGQEFTRGNAVNYWNEPAKMVKELPRPLKECGVVLLKSQSDNTTNYFRVRPDLVRRALCWLIANNPLYEHIQISEDNLRELDQNINQEIPSIPITDDDVSELRGSVSQLNREKQNCGPSSNGVEGPSEDDVCQKLNPDTHCMTGQTCSGVRNESESEGKQSHLATTTTSSNGSENETDILENVTESFELEVNQDDQTEMDHILNSIGADSLETKIPIGNMHRRTHTIDEYKTKQLMQCCFPTLFPDGLGGYHPLEFETRHHEYNLAEYCAHLMKWHDRRYVIHGNFKFFCMNLIQRRQIDGLVRRIRYSETRAEAMELAGCGRTQGESRSSNEKEELSAAMNVLKSLKPYFKVVRGSGLYWSNVREDLMSMIGNRVLPTKWPTFFLTLSAADTIWPDFARACNPALTLEECRQLSFNERRRYLNENPDISARHFNRRFQAFFDNILCGRSKPLGEIVDHFWRVEFQQRGSPHIHCLLWVKDAPDVLKLSETDDGRAELADFVDKHISVLTKTLSELSSCPCSACTASESDILALRPPHYGNKEWNCDLARLVQRVQQHECHAGSTCRKKGNECRFGFPKSLQPRTVIESKTSSDGTPSLKIHLQREVSTINNYSPHLLSCWRANMDLQLIGNSYGAAEYAGAYVSKAEPDTLRFRRVIAKAIQRSDSNLPYHSILKRVANATLAVREVGAPEAIYILLRNLPMHSKSRSITKVKVMRHSTRYYRVEPQNLDDLVALASTPEIETIRIEPIEKAYMNRPDNDHFNAMTLATFVETFETIESIRKVASSDDLYECMNGEGWIKKRKKATVVQKTPWIRPDSSNPTFCFSEVFLYVPWRTLEELPTTDDEAIARFFQAQNSLLDAELKHESNAKLARQYQLDLIKSARSESSITALPPSEYVFVSNTDGEMLEPEPMGAVETSVNQNKPMEWKAKHTYTSAIIDKARDFLNGSLKPWVKKKKESRSLGTSFCQTGNLKSHYQYPTSDNKNLVNTEKMAESQWIPFAIAMEQSRRRFTCMLDKSKCKPLQMIINGEGGSGKSWLIRHIVKDMHNVFGEHKATRRKSKRVLLLAHQGTAAFNIKGMTLCSAFSFSSFSKSSFSIPYKSLTDSKTGPTKLKRLQEEYKDVHLVIIDEFSMISCGMLYWIDKRMREIWPSNSNELFGGRDVYFTGDSARLDPVVPTSLSTPLQKISNQVQRRGKEIWDSIETVCMLTSQNRGALDPDWFSALRRLRKKSPTQDDIDLINSRSVQFVGKPKWMANAKHIAYKNIDVNDANDHSIVSAHVPIVHLTSQHFVQQKRLTTKRDIPAGTVRALLTDAQTANADHDRVVPNRLKLCVGAPITLTYNIAQAAGLCNGTNAIVYDFIFVSGSDLPIVLVQVTDPYIGPSLLDEVPNIVPIPPKDVSWGKASSDLRVVRRGIPLRLAYAMTVHKVQGLTCSCVVFHSNAIPNISFAYVALSRITHRNLIVITQPLTLERLTATPEQLAIFRSEEQRVLKAVAQTTLAASSVVDRMKAVAQAHNSTITPR